jgi:hypothetical protein
MKLFALTGSFKLRAAVRLQTPGHPHNHLRRHRRPFQPQDRPRRVEDEVDATLAVGVVEVEGHPDDKDVLATTAVAATAATAVAGGVLIARKVMAALLRQHHPGVETPDVVLVVVNGGTAAV